MKVHLHTDRNVILDAELAARLEANVAADLVRFAPRLMRVDLHLTDQSAGRNSGKHVRCLVEARLSGLPSVAVTHEAADVRTALDGAVLDLASALTHTFARLEDKGKRDTIRHM